MRAKRTDANQNEIVDAFRKLGFSVFVTSALGNGFVDIVCGKHGLNFLVEIKDGTKFKSQQKLTPKEAEFFSEWKGEVTLITSVADVVRFYNAIEKSFDFFKKDLNDGLFENKE